MPRTRSFHCGSQCGPCFLCKKSSLRSYAHPGTWSEDLYHKLLERNGNINKDSCICRNCEKDGKSGVDRVQYIPRWEKHADTDTTKCMVRDCHNSSRCIQNIAIATVDKVAEILDVTCNSDISDLVLCTDHYKTLHRHIHGNDYMYHPIAKCKMCQAAIHGKVRYCPQKSIIEAYYRDLGYDITIEDDRICTNCYNHQLQVMKMSEGISRDDELQVVINSLHTSMEENGYDDYILTALIHTLTLLGQTLLRNMAALFPEVYDTFIQSALNERENISISEIKTNFPKNCLLTKIVTIFGKHVTCSCQQRSQGIILYRHGVEPLLTLSNTLSHFRKRSCHILDACGNESDIKKDECIKQVSDEVNTLIHEECDRLIQQDAYTPFDIASFDPDSFIDEINPKLWNFIINITKGKRNTSITQNKKLSHIYSLCVLMFCTNRNCSMPLHILFTDIIDSLSGSNELVRILNNFGAVASIDSHKRYMQHQIERRFEKGLTSSLLKNTFTVVTVDNIDYLQSSTLVYCGDQSRSWHGTTIQAVQPLVSQTSSRKRKIHPIPSPIKYICSPQYKKYKRRGRSLSEAQSLNQFSVITPKALFTEPKNPLLQQLCENRYFSLKNASLSDFQPTDNEMDAMYTLQKLCFSYIGIKNAMITTNYSDGNISLSLQSFLKEVRNIECTSSLYTYMNVLDKNADNRDTIADVLSFLYEEFKVEDEVEHLVVAGDAKTFSHLQALKSEYGSAMNWLIPFIGDWHILKNFQLVLMKIYYDTGLKQLASCSGHKGETIKALQNCSNFKRTHRFLMESWEAVYLYMYEEFLKMCPDSQDIYSIMFDTIDNYSNFNLDLLDNHFRAFYQFVSNMGSQDPNWFFWGEFVLSNCCGYISLFLAIRSANWDLRLGALKVMSPIFAAFDRTTYRKLLPQHLADCLIMPTNILASFKEGGFSMSILGHGWHSVALDECHEMLINRDCKDAITRPKKDLMNELAWYFPYRSRTIRNLRELIFKGAESNNEKVTIDKKMNENIQAILEMIRKTPLLPTQKAEIPMSLRNSFTGVTATAEQEHDLLNFREIGQKDFDNLIRQTYLKVEKIKHKRHNLKTLAPSKVTKQRFKAVEKEKKVVTECLKKRILWMQETGNGIIDGEQYLELPRSLATKEGIPQKGQKSSITKFYESKYEKAFTGEFPIGWLPESVIMEGMFLINATPIKIHKKMKEYVAYLFQRFLGWYIHIGVAELHVIFDSPGRLTNHPKDIERERRDLPVDPSHEHMVFQDEMKIPNKWRDVIGCRLCKHALVNYLGTSILELGSSFLNNYQKLFVAGGSTAQDKDTCWYTSKDAMEEVAVSFTCNAEEADTRVWLHAANSYGSRKIIYSPDTDVYHIGLLNMQPQNEVLVQINMLGRDMKFVKVNELSELMKNDNDLRDIDPMLINKIYVALYVISGCDFTSFFVGLSKGSFAKAFLAYPKFITGDTKVAPGTLACHNPDGKGYLACMRLVATTYFIKHKPAFSGMDPPGLYLSLQSDNIEDQHKKFYNCIKEKVWLRISFEDEMPPSIEALERHWLRSIWTLDYWEQSLHNNINTLPLTSFGWFIDDDDRVTVDWDSCENQKAIKNRVSFLTNGCTCKTGCQMQVYQSW